MTMEPSVDCPCCGYITLYEAPHGQICPICFWEYDGFVDYRVTVNSDSNGMTLADARRNFVRHGACKEAALPYVIPPEARRYYPHISDGEPG